MYLRAQHLPRIGACSGIMAWFWLCLGLAIGSELVVLVFPVAWSIAELVDGGSVHWECLTLNRGRAVIIELSTDPCRTSPHHFNAVTISRPFYQRTR